MLHKLKNRKPSGFTIIEVMIVLGIAAAILLIVLIAIPQLQRNQRNTAMKDVMGRIMTELNNYAGNNNGNFPSTGTGGSNPFGTAAAGSASAFPAGSFTDRYLGNININDPRTGEKIGFAFATSAATAVPAVPTDGTGRTANYYYSSSTGFKCNGENIVVGNGGRNVALAVSLEGGAVFCLDNQ